MSHRIQHPCLYFGTGRKPSLLTFPGVGQGDTLYSNEIWRHTK
jgi:hypothetical protein